MLLHVQFGRRHVYHAKVLVVDDDENILSAFRDFLKNEDYVMIAASSAGEAMDRLKKNHVDLVITDVRLKAQSGVTFLLEVKRMLSEVPVIVITGYPEVIGEHDAKIFGADYLFVKPLELDKLRDAMRKCLRHTNVPITHKMHRIP